MMTRSLVDDYNDDSGADSGVDNDDKGMCWP